MSDLGASGGAPTERLELVEAERAAAAAGFDTDAQVVEGRAICPACGATNDLAAVVGSGRDARDTATRRQALEVLVFRCGRCDTPLRAVLDHAAVADDGRPGERSDVQETDRPVSNASFADEVDRFDPAEPGTLEEQRDLIDAEGDDIRMYTGEPVETEAGWVLPVQQNFPGRDNIAGGGEWPDPDAEPAQDHPG